MSDLNPFILCIDLDGPVAEYTKAIRQATAERTGVPVEQIGPQTAWEFYKSEGWPISNREEYMQIHNQAVDDGMFRSMKVVEGASDALWELSEEGIHVRVVTHRLINKWSHARVVADTVEWLQASRPDGRPTIPYRDICFLSQKFDLAGDVLVEDSPANLEGVKAAKDRNLPAPYPIIYDTPYNRHVDGVRAKTWDEIYATIHTYKEWSESNPFA
jgi:5'-nucleotidase